MKTRSRIYFLCLFFTLSFPCCTYAQSAHGLGFYSHEVVQDKRTGLDLSPGETICLPDNFDLSFDLSLFPSRKDYFGYILRMVNDQNENIDLIYDKNAAENARFKIVIGEQFSNIAFNIPSSALFSKWNTLTLSIDYGKKLLKLNSGNKRFQAALDLKGTKCFKLLFGANEYLDFKTTDVPPMKIRNVVISEGKEVKYQWLLNDYNGTAVAENRHDKAALATNPLWIRRMHYEWQLVLNAKVNGPASVAFDDNKELMYIVGNDSLISYNAKINSSANISYASGKLNLLRGNQSLLTANGNLLNFYIDTKMVSVFDWEDRKWTKNYNPKTNITDYWLFNKFYTSVDSSLYVIGGYGHFIYKNELLKYHFPSNSWKTIDIKGDALTPRYLAALGQSDKGAYLLGGYGSSTGQQMLNPRNLYDLLYFDPQSRHLKKIYELKVKGADFVFANSMIIDEKNKNFYALQFPKNKYKSALQLISGSLEKPVFKLSGSPIPYLFHDIRSFADLYYCKESKRFIAVTLYWDDHNQTSVKVYTLNAPPIDQPPHAAGTSSRLLYAVIGILLVFLVFLIHFVKRNRTSKKQEVQKVQPIKEETVPTLRETVSSTENQNAIFLFGDMQVFDKVGAEITKQFTPLIRELFLVILIYSIRWERGISSEKLKELLWFDKTEESARNNRSVSIVKLKGILDKMDGCTLSKDTGYWKLNIEPELMYADYLQYHVIAKKGKSLDRRDLLALAEIIRRGPFLPNADYEWLDSLKAEISSAIIDCYLHYAHTTRIADDPEFLVQLSNHVFYFDSVNEEAMLIKCRALAYLGKHSQAKKTYENFCKEYRLLYNTDFAKDFKEVLSTD